MKARGSRSIGWLPPGRGWVFVVALLAAGWLGRDWFRATSPEERLRAAEQALARRDFGAALELASQVPHGGRHASRAALVAGEAALQLGNLESAAEHYAAVPRDGSTEGNLAEIARAELWFALGRLAPLEEELHRILERDPENAPARGRLIQVLTLEGRRWEAIPLLAARLDAHQGGLDIFLTLTDPERPVENSELLRTWERSSPKEGLVQLCLAIQSATEGRPDAARLRLDSFLSRHPGSLPGQALLGGLLIAGGDQAFRDWHAALPAGAEANPDIWCVRGLYAQQAGKPLVAARCFWETVRRAPNHRRATYQLGQTLISLRETGESAAAAIDATDAESFAARARSLNSLSQILEKVHSSEGRSEPAVRRTISLLEETGQVRLAYHWAMLASAAFPRSGWPNETLTRLAKTEGVDSWNVPDGADLSRRVDLASWPGIDSLLAPGQEHRSSPLPQRDLAEIRFRREDEGRLDFTYFNGKIAGARGARMQEQTGGGVGVLDFDCDGWPDLFLPQGGAWRADEDHPAGDSSARDSLFHNRGGKTFDRVVAAGLGDGDFGQGCSAGDLNHDGFPDLYVANIGLNRLWINNGDGTFSNLPFGLPPLPETWTTSCAIVDLNADGHPDLYDVNYVTGERVYERVCNGKACSPRGFTGVPDDLWLSDGQGGFSRHVPSAAEVDGKGLGIVAFTQETAGRPNLFIANDQVPNFLLRNTPTGTGDDLHLENEGFASGLAFNLDGLAMASMGVAADDANGDGLLDFFVTNFQDEYDALYLQQPGGVFTDGSTAAGLRGDNFRYVGWGTQFLDADLDGESDLVAVNGHVDDYRSEGGEYGMLPQFYRNLGAGRFAQLSVQELGSYFGDRFVGRGLARLDWNRDGLIDFAVSNIGEPAALVTNATGPRGRGRFLNCRLVGTKSSRDAIGTTVEVRAGERRWIKQLVGGDGYMASNERVLQFGVGAAAEVDSIEVRWPSGSISRTEGVQTGDTLVFVEEGRAALTLGGENPSLVAIVPAKPENQDAVR